MIKIFGLVLILLLNFKILKSVNAVQIPLFYTIIPALEILKFFFLDPDYSQGRIVQFLLGLLYWLASLMVCKVIFKKVKEHALGITERSLKIFVLLNFLFSFYQIYRICRIEGVINPYNTDHDHPYGISSGDMISGLFHGVHLTNAFVSLLLVLYFAHRRDFLFLFLSFCPLLLCGSNYASIVLIFSLGVFFLFNIKRGYAFIISGIITAALILFYCFVTPINAKYAITKVGNVLGQKPINDEKYYARIDNKKAEIRRKRTAHIVYPTLSILDFCQEKNKAIVLIDRTVSRKKLKNYDFVNQPGKKTAFRQTFSFLKSDTKHFLFGSGMGRFSSALAFNFSGVTDHHLFIRYFPHYESDSFRNNHKSIFEFMKGSHIVFHSESNIPFSTYNQLLGEYGIVGFVCFLLFYVGFFVRRVSRRNYAFPVILVMLFAVNLDYFIESLSFLLFFELLMFMNIKEKESVGQQKPATTAIPV